MNWFWMNIPLAVAFFLAWTLIPLWMVIRHPDANGPDSHLTPVPDPMQAAPPTGPAIQPEAAQDNHAPGRLALAGHVSDEPPAPARELARHR